MFGIETTPQGQPDDAAALRAEIVDLRAQIAQREAQVAEKERELARSGAYLLEALARERAHVREVRNSYAATVRALANAVEARDAYTGKHAERVAAYGLAIARAGDHELAARPEIEFGFLLHDVGKVAIPDAILFKPTRLSTDERRLMERHPAIGAEILREIDFLGAAKDVVRSHHERWDGGGYPDGLRGESIPLAARVFAVADALDALTTRRPYRAALSFSDAHAIIAAAAGTQFDPAVVEAYERVGDGYLEGVRIALS